MLNLKLKTEGLPEAQKLFRQAPHLMEQVIRAALARTSEAVVKKIKLNLHKVGGRTFGYLWNSIWFKIENEHGDLVAHVGPGLKDTKSSAVYGDPLNYGFFVEHGRDPGGLPPEGAIRAWAREKIGDDDPRLVWAIRKKIALKGVEARPYIEPVAKEGARITAIFNRALDIEIDRVMGRR